MRVERIVLAAFPRLALHSLRFRYAGALFGLAPMLLGLWLAGCPSPHPTIQVTSQTNEAGGTLHITGTGFNLGDPVVIKIENVPGIGTWSSSAGKTTDHGGKTPAGSIDVMVAYSRNIYSALPGCAYSGNSPNYYATLNITATASEDDGSSYSSSPAQQQVVNCGWQNLHVSATQ